MSRGNRQRTGYRRSRPTLQHHPGESSDAFASEESAEYYSSAELIRFQQEFRPRAESYTHRNRTSVRLACLILILLIPLSISVAYDLSYGAWLCKAAVAICLVAILYLEVTARINCTACDGDLDMRLGSYCPECGGELGNGRKNNFEADCGSCGAHVRFNWQSPGRRIRDYKIRACSYCGVKLHEDGV